MLGPVGRAIADRFRALQPTIVVSAAVGGILLGYEVARHLGVKAIFVEKENGAPVLRRGFTLSSADRALVVEDVVTTGLSVGEVDRGRTAPRRAARRRRRDGNACGRRFRRADARVARSAAALVRGERMSAVRRERADNRSRVAPRMTLQVRVASGAGEAAAADRAFVIDLGRRCAMSSVGALRRASEPAVRAAFDRLCDVVDDQSHVTLIAQRAERRVGFLMLLDGLPDEVTALAQGFIAYMAVEPECRGAGVGAALLAAAEDEARRRGLPYMALMVTEENAVARRLYEQGGYLTERRLLCKPL